MSPPRRQYPFVDTANVPRELSEDPESYRGTPPDMIPERLLTNPAWAEAYHRINRTPVTQPVSDAREEWRNRPMVDISAPVPREVSEDPRNYVGADPENIPERLLTDPSWADAYHRLNRTQPTPPTVPEQPPAVAVTVGAPQITSRVPRDVRVSQGAPGMSPRPFESLAAYAPADSGEKLAAMPAEVPQNGDSGGPMGAVQKLAMGGAAPDGIHPALAPLRDTGLKLAQKVARERALLANLTRAGGMMIGRGNDAAYSTLDRAAGQPVEDFLQQQQLDSQAASARAAQAEAARRAGLEERAMALKERPEPADPLAERKVRADEMRARAAMISANRPGGGGGGDGLTPYQRARLDLDMAERNVPGFEFAEGGVPTRPSGEELRKTISRVGAIERSLNTMKDVFNRKGAEFGFGADLASSQAAEQEVLLNLKELENLGVLQKVDVDTLAGLYPRPNTMRGALDPAGMRAKFDEFERVLRDTVAERAQARGYVPSAGGRWAGQGAGNARPAGATPPRPGMVRIRDPRTGRTGWATPDAVPAGAEVVR